jgi:hypothetical protein
MVTLYIAYYWTAGIVLGSVVVVTLVRKLISRYRPKPPPLPPKRRLPSDRWSDPARTSGQHWKN